MFNKGELTGLVLPVEVEVEEDEEVVADLVRIFHMSCGTCLVCCQLNNKVSSHSLSVVDVSSDPCRFKLHVQIAAVVFSWVNAYLFY